MQYGDASSFYISEYHRTVRAKFIFWNLLFQSLWYILVKLNISMTWRLKIYFEDILPNGVKEADGGCIMVPLSCLGISKRVLTCVLTTVNLVGKEKIKIFTL